ncbi:MAG: hypothetical protein HWN67_15915 [Candidatus Helarchaeota archaeon]|nr:hypothetical protein [Candidatus Helarchaeota archaeon]
MSEEEKEDKGKMPFKVISSDTSVKVPDDLKEEKEAVKELLDILKPKVTAPKPISSKPISLGPKKVKPIFSATQKPQPKPIKITSPPKPSTLDQESDIVTEELEGEDVSEDLLKMSSILKEIKEEEIAGRIEEQEAMDIPDEKQIIGIQVECPNCGRRILLDRTEFLKYGYSDYCPHCNLMVLPNVLPDDYEPPEAPPE